MVDIEEGDIMPVIDLRKALKRRMPRAKLRRLYKRAMRADRLNRRSTIPPALAERLKAGRTPYTIERLKKR